MSKATTDRKTGTQKDVKQPTALKDGDLDEISGGPHFRNFHGASFDFATPVKDLTETQAASAVKRGK